MQSVLSGRMFDLGVSSHEVVTLTGQSGTNLTSASFSLSERTWASSDGGPGLNLGEHIAGRSMLGTVQWSTGNLVRWNSRPCIVQGTYL